MEMVLVVGAGGLLLAVSALVMQIHGALEGLLPYIDDGVETESDALRCPVVDDVFGVDFQ